MGKRRAAGEDDARLSEPHREDSGSWNRFTKRAARRILAGADRLIGACRFDGRGGHAARLDCRQRQPMHRAEVKKAAHLVDRRRQAERADGLQEFCEVLLKAQGKVG